MNNTKPAEGIAVWEDAGEDAGEDERNALRGTMLSATNLYHASRLAAADTKATSLMAISGVGIGFLAQRTSLQAASIPDAAVQVLQHPSLLLLFSVIVLAVLAQRPVHMKGGDWLSHLIAGAPSRAVADEFMAQTQREIFRNWVHSQSIFARIANRKYRLVAAATWLLMAGFGLAILGA